MHSEEDLLEKSSVNRLHGYRFDLRLLSLEKTGTQHHVLGVFVPVNTQLFLPCLNRRRFKYRHLRRGIKIRRNGMDAYSTNGYRVTDSRRDRDIQRSGFESIAAVNSRRQNVQLLWTRLARRHTFVQGALLEGSVSEALRAIGLRRLHTYDSHQDVR
jgi:hypothetical protein